jgi:hypothetical protein
VGILKFNISALKQAIQRQQSETKRDIFRSIFADIARKSGETKKVKTLKPRRLRVKIIKEVYTYAAGAHVSKGEFVRDIAYSEDLCKVMTDSIKINRLAFSEEIKEIVIQKIEDEYNCKGLHDSLGDWTQQLREDGFLELGLSVEVPYPRIVISIEFQFSTVG